MSKITEIQTILGVKADGIWGPKSQAALDVETEGTAEGWIKATASTFADPADVRAFERCKATGKSDQECFKVGDNGIGMWGANTAQDHTPMVAVHADDMIRLWGSINASEHKLVEVQVNGVIFKASVEDRLGVKGRIDLNPACCNVIGIAPGFTVPCRWRKA